MHRLMLMTTMISLTVMIMMTKMVMIEILMKIMTKLLMTATIATFFKKQKRIRHKNQN